LLICALSTLIHPKSGASDSDVVAFGGRWDVERHVGVCRHRFRAGCGSGAPHRRHPFLADGAPLRGPGRGAPGAPARSGSASAGGRAATRARFRKRAGSESRGEARGSRRWSGNLSDKGRAKESSGNFPSPEESARTVREAPGRREQVSSAEAGEQRRERTPKAGAPGAAASRPKDGAPLLGVKAPHPDDDVTPRVWNSSVSEFFQRKYDLYLEHYEGYVRLAERTYRMRDEAGQSPGTLRTREWTTSCVACTTPWIGPPRG
jgi:hypothetical protein